MARASSAEAVALSARVDMIVPADKMRAEAAEPSSAARRVIAGDDRRQITLMSPLIMDAPLLVAYEIRTPAGSAAGRGNPPPSSGSSGRPPDACSPLTP